MYLFEDDLFDVFLMNGNYDAFDVFDDADKVGRILNIIVPLSDNVCVF